MTKPLFFALCTEWFLRFEGQTKDTEYRAYGDRWNERTCFVGRPATLSLGYSGRRLKRVVAGFTKLPWHEAPPEAKAIYPNVMHIAAIRLRALAAPTADGEGER